MIKDCLKFLWVTDQNVLHLEYQKDRHSWGVDDKFYIRSIILKGTGKMFTWKCLVASWKWSRSLGEKSNLKI